MLPLALQLAARDHPVWRLLALIAIAIAFWTYIILLYRAKRRPKQNSLPPDTYTIKLWKVDFPELNHLPEADRDRLLRSALENAEVEQFRRRTRKLMAIIFYGAIAIVIALGFTTNLPSWLVTVCSVPALLITFIATFFIRIQLELKIIRRLLKQKLITTENSAGSAK
jgi:hypothetical protein